jgi:hypothetical protein
MNTLSGYLKKMGYLVFVLIIIAFWGCGGGSSSGGNEDIAENDIIIRDIQIPNDSTVQDIQNDIESKDVIDDVKDTSEDIFDAGLADTIEDIIIDSGCKDECTENVCKDNKTLKSCGDWDNDGCKEYKEVVCENGCANGECTNCIPNCTNKECGDDGCGGSCGSCGDNAVCRIGICECLTGFGNCNGKWDDGCEANFSSDPHHCSDCATDCGDNSICNNKVCECKDGYDNCNGKWIDGCEKNLTNDPNNCGSCGKSCGNNGICVNSQCDCISPYLNCNGLLSDGCEVNKDTDVNNCGGCGNICKLPNTAVNSCVSGSCKVVSCVNGYVNCNGLDSDGCEVNKDTDVNNCGGCGNICKLPNTAVNSCVSGSCKVGSCISGYGNCDGVDSNGCETDLTSINSCGTSCSNKVVCSSTNGTNPVCDNGICRLTCVSGYADCNAGIGSSDGCEKQLDPKHLWSKRFGGSNDDWGNSVFVDSSGNVYVTGWFRSYTIDFGGGALTNAGVDDIFLAKFDSNGNHLWSKRFGGSGDDRGYSVSVDSSGNVYITGYFMSSTIDFGGGALTNAGYADIFLAKFDSNGNHLWSKRFGGSSSDIGSSVSVDSSGNVYITGYFGSSTIGFGGGALTNAGGSCYGYTCLDIFLAKFDSNGNHLWSKRFGGSSDDQGNSVSVDSSGNVYITGYFGSSTIGFGGGALTNAGNDDIFLAKFDNNGNHLWSKRFGGSDNDEGYSVSVDSSGNVYITGYFGSSTINFGGGELTNAGSCYQNGCYADIFLAKFDSNGNHKWSRRFGGSDNDEGYSVSVDSSGNVYITGSFWSSTIDFGGGALTNAGGTCHDGMYDRPCSDIFLAKFDSNGNHLWSKRFGGSSDDEGQSISVDSSGNVYGIGWFGSSTIDFGGCPLSNAGWMDTYLIKYAP